MAPPVGIKEKTRSVKRYLRALEKKHKPGYPPETLNVLEKLLLQFLTFHAPQTNALKALRRLKEVFVDWNDVRVSSIREIAAVLEEHRLDTELAYPVKEILGEVFHFGHGLSLEFLLEEEPDRARRYLSRFKTMPNWLATYLLDVMALDSTVPLDPHTSRVCQRLGLFGRKSSIQTRRSTLSSIVSDADVLRFHHLLVEHGKKTCREREPRCDICALSRDCEYRRKRKRTKGGK